jgi:hypothetical protein
MQNDKAAINTTDLKETAGLWSLIGANITSAAESTKIINKLTAGLSASAGQIVDKISLFDDELIKASRALGQSVGFAKNLEQNFGFAAEKILKIGGTSDEVIKIFKMMSEEMGRTVSFTENALFNMSLLRKVGVDDASIKSFGKLFDTIGGTFEEATTQQMMLVNQAKSYGLNVAQFMSSVAGQLTKINQYGFPNGVKDLGEMVAKSKLLGGNIEMAAGLADKIMGSPETALDLASQLQTLGGSFASLGDPMELLFLAQNDLAGLNDKLMNATRGLATFNKETGQFEISMNERMRIKQVATAFGTDSKSIIENATKLAKQEEILRQLDFTSSLKSLAPEQKEVLASFSQIGKGGTITIEGKNIGEFTTDQITEVLKRVQGAGSQLAIDGDKAQEENITMIQKNSSSIEKVTMAQNVFSNALSITAIQLGEFDNILDGLASKYGGAVAAGATFKAGFGKAVGEKLNEFEETELAKKMAEKLELVGAKLEQIAFPKFELSTEKPIVISFDTSFEISDVAKTSLKKDLQSFVQSEIERRMNGGGTGADKPYGSGVKTK